MTLTKNEMKKIEAEERARIEIRERLKAEQKQPKKKSWLRFFLGAILALTVLYTVTILALGDGVIESSDIDNRESDIQGNVNFDGSLVHISNLDTKDWNSCYFLLNEDWQYPTPAKSAFQGSYD